MSFLISQDICYMSVFLCPVVLSFHKLFIISVLQDWFYVIDSKEHSSILHMDFFCFVSKIVFHLVNWSVIKGK